MSRASSFEGFEHLCIAIDGLFGITLHLSDKGF